MQEMDRKQILIAGTGRYTKFEDLDAETIGKFGSAEKISAAVAAEVEAAQQKGYDCESNIVNPVDVEAAILQLEAKLKSQHWDGLSIGYGIRSTKAYTPLSEMAVNLCREIPPTTKLGFSTAPDDLVAMLERLSAKEGQPSPQALEILYALIDRMIGH